MTDGFYAELGKLLYKHATVQPLRRTFKGQDFVVLNPGLDTQHERFVHIAKQCLAGNATQFNSPSALHFGESKYTFSSLKLGEWLLIAESDFAWPEFGPIARRWRVCKTRDGEPIDEWGAPEPKRIEPQPFFSVEFGQVVLEELFRANQTIERLTIELLSRLD